MTERPVIIDGSQGEGGGQILRSSLALALVTGRSVELQNIRAGRRKPGLMRQHLTAVQAATEIGNAQVEGARIGADKLTFRPGKLSSGQYRFGVGSAGSATLVLQTILPALMVAESPSSIELEGGTHNPWAPPFDFLQRAYLPLVNRMGPQLSGTIERHGFYPAGGGKFRVEILPSRSLCGLDLQIRGNILGRKARILNSNLPEHIADREKKKIIRRLNWDESEIVIESIRSPGPGNIVLAEIESEEVTEIFTSFGRQEASAEAVAQELVDQVQDYLAAGVPVGPYLADQLLLPLGMGAWQERNSTQKSIRSFRTSPLTRHSKTHIDLLKTFLGIGIEVVPEDDSRNVIVKLTSE